MIFLVISKLKSKHFTAIKVLFFRRCRIRVPKVPFCVFDKLKNETQNFVLRFCFCK